MNPFDKIVQLIGEFESKKDSNNIDELQRLREDISINFFHLSEPLGTAISLYEKYEHDRKIKMAEQINYYRSQKFTVSESENKARIDAKPEAYKATAALLKKEKAKIILTAIPQILNSISSRINNIG